MSRNNTITAIAALNTLAHVSKMAFNHRGPLHKCRACFQVALNRLSLECRICNTPYDILQNSPMNNVTPEEPVPALMAIETKETPIEGQYKRKRESGRGPYKKSAIFMIKAAAKRTREASEAISLQGDFDEWFEKYCVYDDSVNLSVICAQLRKKASNSYQKYCERKNNPYLNKKGFDAAINAKTGSVPVQGTGNNWRFKHIKFMCVGKSSTKKTEPLTPHQQKTFDDWFNTYCEIKIQNNNPIKVIKIQLRSKGVHSYNNYCEVKGCIKAGKDQFNETLRVKMGTDFDGDSTCIGRKRCYKHIVFNCCGDQDCCDKTNVLCPNRPY